MLSKTWVCGRFIDGGFGFESRGGHGRFFVLCVVRSSSLRRAEHSCREVLSSVVFRTGSDCGTSTVVRPRPARDCGAKKKITRDVGIK